MDPSVVTGQQPIERFHQVRLASGTQFHDHHASGGVRDKYVQETVLVGGNAV